MKSGSAILADYWAKSPIGSETVGESLISHTAAVLKRLSQFYVIYPKLAEICKNDKFWYYAFCGCLLHDFGKLASGFQQQLRPGGTRWGKRHEVLSLAFVGWVIPDDLDRTWVSAGIASHHKDFSEVFERYPVEEDDDCEEESVLQALTSEVPSAILAPIAKWLDEKLPILLSKSGLPILPWTKPTLQDPELEFIQNAAHTIGKRLEELRRLRRHLNRLPADHRDNLTAIALRGLIILSDHTASAKVSPLRNPFANTTQLTEALGFESKENLYTHQLASSLTEGNAILIAPTGSGKTEAALLWVANEMSSSPRGRIFYVLPYQASINAMYSRLDRAFPKSVALQHSRALQALYRSLLAKGYSAAAAIAGAKRGKSLARLHHYPLRVLTPYQLLRAAFRLQGYESLITDCAQASFIFDEIHAFEPHRMGMILAAIQYLNSCWDCHFFIMSATLPTRVQDELCRTIGNHTLIRADNELYRKFDRHRLWLLDSDLGDEPALDKIIQDARSGLSVLVVCNTVAKAKQIYQDLRSQALKHDIPVELIHSRFNARDRFSKEVAILSHMGTRVRVGVQPTILVSTQVVEVSLDIDFDTIFTEPAPLEALLQRFGRVNRGRKQPLRDVYVMQKPTDGQHVYEEYYVKTAVELLAPINGEVLHENSLQDLLDQVYSGQETNRWFTILSEGMREFTDACLQDLRAFDSNADLEDKFDAMFDGSEVLPRSLLHEYEMMQTNEALRAQELIVAISNRQLGLLHRKGLIERRKQDSMLVADVPYDSEFGLRIEAV